MNRLGWGILLLFLAVGAVFALMLGSGGGRGAAVFRQHASVSGSAALMIPVVGVRAGDLTDTWGQSRAGGARRHEAIDIMAPLGTPVVAARAGTIERLFESGEGGHTVYVRTDDGTEVDYYAHLDRYRSGLHEGQSVRQGEVIGKVGYSGNASPNGPHLHFEVKHLSPGDRWHQGEPRNPYPLLAGSDPGS